MNESRKSKGFTVMSFKGEAANQVVNYLCETALEKGDKLLVIPPKKKSKKKPFWKL